MLRWEKKQQSLVQSKRYHNLKSLAHLPLAIRLCCVTKDFQALQNYTLKLKQLMPLLENTIEYKENLSLVKQSLEVSQAILMQPQRTEALLTDYQNTIKACLHNLTYLATADILENLQATMNKWSQSNNVDFAQTRVIIACTHGPRQRLSELQYFQKLFQEKLAVYNNTFLEDNYIYMTEVLPYQLSEPEKLERNLIQQLLVGSEVNKLIGEKVLEDPKGLFKDVLHQDAEQILGQGKCLFHSHQLRRTHHETN